MTRATVSAALQVLTTPIVGGHQRPDSTRQYQHLALIVKGQGAARMPKWYVPDRRTNEWRFELPWLNDAEKFDSLRRERWPALFRRRGKQARGRTRPARKGRQPT
jgi:predicted secreted protein